VKVKKRFWGILYPKFLHICIGAKNCAIKSWAGTFSFDTCSVSVGLVPWALFRPFWGTFRLPNLDFYVPATHTTCPNFFTKKLKGDFVVTCVRSQIHFFRVETVHWTIVFTPPPRKQIDLYFSSKTQAGCFTP
jgi:hypothetical protein